MANVNEYWDKNPLKRPTLLISPVWEAFRELGLSQTRLHRADAMLQSRSDPVKVTEHILAWLVANNSKPSPDAQPGLRCSGTPPEGVAWFREFGKGALEAAKASAERWARKEPLSVFDGVPFAAKDNQDTLGYGTYCGTTTMPLQCASVVDSLPQFLSYRAAPTYQTAG
jgi:Asp-tRNA(Asn)/Glu-tRNA(Gln) amidotransferase A subunit family amidase